MGSYLPIGERLTEERKRLGYNQTDFAALIGITRKTLFGYESGERAPDAGALAVWAGKGLDVMYVVTGRRAQIVTERSYAATSQHMTENSDSVTTEVDEVLMRRIITMLAKTAKDAGRRWDSERLMLAAVDVYKFLAKEEAVDDDKLERVLKLVVNR